MEKGLRAIKFVINFNDNALFMMTNCQCVLPETGAASNYFNASFEGAANDSRRPDQLFQKPVSAIQPLPALYESICLYVSLYIT